MSVRKSQSIIPKYPAEFTKSQVFSSHKGFFVLSGLLVLMTACATPFYLTDTAQPTATVVSRSGPGATSDLTVRYEATIQPELARVANALLQLGVYDPNWAPTHIFDPDRRAVAVSHANELSRAAKAVIEMGAPSTLVNQGHELAKGMNACLAGAQAYEQIIGAFDTQPLADMRKQLQICVKIVRVAQSGIQQLKSGDAHEPPPVQSELVHLKPTPPATSKLILVPTATLPPAQPIANAYISARFALALKKTNDNNGIKWERLTVVKTRTF